MNSYKCYKMGEAHQEQGKLICENQEVGTGDGYMVRRNLYERADKSRYSVQITPPIWIEQKVIK